MIIHGVQVKLLGQLQDTLGLARRMLAGLFLAALGILVLSSSNCTWGRMPSSQLLFTRINPQAEVRAAQGSTRTL